MAGPGLRDSSRPGSGCRARSHFLTGDPDAHCLGPSLLGKTTTRGPTSDLKVTCLHHLYSAPEDFQKLTQHSNWDQLLGFLSDGPFLDNK